MASKGEPMKKIILFFFALIVLVGTVNAWVQEAEPISVTTITRNEDDIKIAYDGTRGNFSITFESGVIYNNNYYSMAQVNQLVPALKFSFPTWITGNTRKYAVNISNIPTAMQPNIQYITLTYKEHDGFTLDQLKSNKDFVIKDIMRLGFDDLIENGFTFDINVTERRVYIGNLTFKDDSLYLDPTVTWSSDTGIVSGLSTVTGGYSSPAVFLKNNVWFLISGGYYSSFVGYNWTGTTWQSDAGIIKGIVGSAYTIPTAFQKDNTWYLIVGDSYSTFNGYFWNGTGWNQSNMIVKGLTTVAYKSAPTAFQKDNTWYLISKVSGAVFYGYFWNGTAWNQSNLIVKGLTTVGYGGLDVFYKSPAFYLIAGDYNGAFTGFNWTEPNLNLTITSPTTSSSATVSAGSIVAVNFTLTDYGTNITSGVNVVNVTVGSVISNKSGIAYSNGWWTTNVTMPSGLTGLQNLFLNISYDAYFANTTQASALNFGGGACGTYSGTGNWVIDNCNYTLTANVVVDGFLNVTSTGSLNYTSYSVNATKYYFYPRADRWSWLFYDIMSWIIRGV